MSEFPYLDAIQEACDRGDPEVLRAFGRHLHWGYWEHPESADGSVEDFERASEAMARLVSARAGSVVLDVGCGFGGTLATLNETRTGVSLTGLNIDPRQLERARRLVQARPGNSIEFVEGSAEKLPFGDASFDTVMAVECAFHFPSRDGFFSEARRVLRPGGMLIVSDFVAAKDLEVELPSHNPFYGPSETITLDKYVEIGRHAGLGTQPDVTDVTSHVAPTYPFLLGLLPRLSIPSEISSRGTRALQWISREGMLRYLVLAYRHRT